MRAFESPQALFLLKPRNVSLRAILVLHTSKLISFVLPWISRCHSSWFPSYDQGTFKELITPTCAVHEHPTTSCEHSTTNNHRNALILATQTTSGLISCACLSTAQPGVLGLGDYRCNAPRYRNGRPMVRPRDAVRLTLDTTTMTHMHAATARPHSPAHAVCLSPVTCSQ